MGYKSENNNREDEICNWYFALMKVYLSKGNTFLQARNLVYDAIELRFQISKKRAYTIINKHTKKTNTKYLGEYIQRNLEMIDILNDMLSYYREEINTLSKHKGSINTCITSYCDETIANLNNKIAEIECFINVLNITTNEYKNIIAKSAKRTLNQ